MNCCYVHVLMWEDNNVLRRAMEFKIESQRRKKRGGCLEERGVVKSAWRKGVLKSAWKKLGVEECLKEAGS